MGRVISPEEADRDHGVTTLHEHMADGERRFRLRKSDGTAYIRTEAGPTGAWGESHYHASVRETYIVQEGWIAYAEISEGEPKYNQYDAGEMLTTRPGVIHTVYMPAQAVIHTVKHGEASGEDRITDEQTKMLDQAVRCLQGEDQIRREATQKGRSVTMKVKDPEKSYPPALRHFDWLIWQVPAWSTAIFLVTAVGVNSIQQAGFLSEATDLRKEAIASAFLVLMSLVILALSHALYQFRRHQWRIPIDEPLGTPRWASASMYLQIVVTTEAFALLFLAVSINPPLQKWAFGVACVLAIVVITLYREFRLHS
jgi:uncharacterized membrane protein YidH (DUF202 family)